MPVIQSKAVIRQIMIEISCLNKENLNDWVVRVNHALLQQKVKFPMLELAAKQLFDLIPKKSQVKFCDKIISLQTIGGNVIAGMMLQLRLEDYFRQSHKKALEYIIKGNQWYVCDIIGERVMGYSLLHYPKETLPLLKAYAKHPDKWIVRSVGVAAHYAVKKGLKKKDVESVFLILLSCASSKDFHTKKGIGWAAKTISKFHPEIIKKHHHTLNSKPEIKTWFKTKIKIGLGRAYKYATRYTD